MTQQPKIWPDLIDFNPVKKTTFSLRMEPEIHYDLKKEALSRKMTLSNLIELICKDFLEKNRA